MNFREETKGRFRKRAVLENVPSFRFLVLGNIRMYPRSGFWYRGTSACTLVWQQNSSSAPNFAKFRNSGACRNRTKSIFITTSIWKQFWPPPPSIFAKNMPPKYAIQWGSVWHKSRLKSRDFYRKYGIRTQKYGIRTPPFMPYEPFLLGVGVAFNLLSYHVSSGGKLFHNYHPGRHDCRILSWKNYFCYIFVIFSSKMKSAFVRITKRIASNSKFCKVFCNNFGRGGIPTIVEEEVS